MILGITQDGSNITCRFQPGANWIDIGAKGYNSFGHPLWEFETEWTVDIGGGLPCVGESGEAVKLFCEIFSEDHTEWAYKEKVLCGE